MRRAAKVDLNHGAVVDALRAKGYLVLSLAAIGKGCPDLLVCHPFSLNYFLLEVKNPETSRGRKGLNPAQKEFRDLGWSVIPVTGSDDALEAVKVGGDSGDRIYQAGYDEGLQHGLTNVEGARPTTTEASTNL